MDHVELGSALDGGLRGFALDVILPFEMTDEGIDVASPQVDNEVGVDAGSRDPMGRAGDGADDAIRHPQPLQSVDDRSDGREQIGLDHAGRDWR